MVSVWTSNLVIKVLAGIAVLFGIATLVSGGSALFELHGTENSTAQIVPFVLYFNFAAGFAYIVTGAGLILKRRWAPVSAVAIAVATIIVFLGLVLLCHKVCRWIFRWQHGHRNSRRTKARANLVRMLAIDETTWRSGLIGRSAGSITVG